MTGIMTYTLEATRRIPIADISTSERFHEPAQKQIDEMAASLDRVGQLTAIMVHPVTRNSWRIVAGGTRLRAAFKLGWTHIRADIISGSQADYRIIELTENIDRRNLTAVQRKEARAELKKLIQGKLASIKAAAEAKGKGGRGKRSGLSEAARQTGVPETTARRVMAHNDKPRQKADSGEVSAPTAAASSGPLFEAKTAPKPNGHDNSEAPAVRASPAAPAPNKATPSVAFENMKAPIPISVKVTNGERSRVERYNKAHYGNGPLSDGGRKMWAKLMDIESFF